MASYRKFKDHKRRPSAKARVIAEFRRYWEPLDLGANAHQMPDLVKSTLQELKLEERFDEQQVFQAWNELVPPFVAQNARPDSMRHKILYIQVLHPTIHYELQRMTGQILAKMQSRFGENNIREVKFRIG